MMKPAKGFPLIKSILAWSMKSRLEEYRDFDVKEIAKNRWKAGPLFERGRFSRTMPAL